jgi:transposase
MGESVARLEARFFAAECHRSCGGLDKHAPLQFEKMRGHQPPPIIAGIFPATRHLSGGLLPKLKQFRHVATRFEKTARNYLAGVTLSTIVLWLR